ncbi:hypothetical protein TCEA9_24000 [Thermobrachium celere]|nr:hypothetical protein TCEA9_24000 [Thermobrachium celere]
MVQQYLIILKPKKKENSSSDGSVLGWVILFLMLAGLGPFGIILFFIILYIAKKN